MSDTFKLTLGGRLWELPDLPWRATKSLQMRFLKINEVMGGGESETSRISNLSESDVDLLASAVYDATQLGEGPKLTIEEFGELPISLVDMVKAMLVISKACGLGAGTQSAPGVKPAAQGGDDKPGK